MPVMLNRIWQSDPALDKYWVTHGGYFRLATIVELVMGIPDGNILFCHEISDGRVENKISTREYNNRTVCD